MILSSPIISESRIDKIEKDLKDVNSAVLKATETFNKFYTPIEGDSPYHATITLTQDNLKYSKVILRIPAYTVTAGSANSIYPASASVNKQDITITRGESNSAGIYMGGLMVPNTANTTKVYIGNEKDQYNSSGAFVLSGVISYINNALYISKFSFGYTFIQLYIRTGGMTVEYY